MPDAAPTHTTLLVDFGGVLTSSVWASFEAFCRSEGIEPGTIKRLFREDPEALADLRRLETGSVGEDEFSESFGARLGVAERKGLVDRLFAGMGPAEPMINAVRRARTAGVKTGLISNSWALGTYDREMLDELFDDSVISGEVGLHKPQPEIYILATERLGVTPKECVFVDDLRENCAGAEAVGMTAVLHRDPADTVARLEELFEIQLQG